MGECMHISLIVLKAIDRHIEILHIWTDSMTVYSWITNPALHTERFISPRVANILENQKKFNAVRYSTLHHVAVIQSMIARRSIYDCMDLSC